MASSIGRTFIAKAASGAVVGAVGKAPRFQSAARQLAKHGVDALKPSCTIINRQRYPHLNNAATATAPDTINLYPPEASVLPVDKIWRSSSISKRKANVMRKQAIADGTYGTFDATTGLGWDFNWDIELEKNKQGNGRGRYRMSIPKKSIQRLATRENRALQIEKKMIGMQERMDDYYRTKHAKKPPISFENTYKQLMRAKKK